MLVTEPAGPTVETPAPVESSTETPVRDEAAVETPAPIDLDDPKLYINRELSQLDFFWRVLDEARDERNPLLERVKFLAIVSSILDEFFMVRVAGLRQQIEAGVVDIPPDGLTPAEQLAAIRKMAHKQMLATRECWRETLLPKLAEQNITVYDYAELSDSQRARVDRYFTEVIFPVLTPLGLDPGRPFPHISNLSLNLAVIVRDDAGSERFARVKVPDTLPRLVPIKRSSGGVRKDGTPPGKHRFVWLEQVIATHLGQLFPGMQVVEAHPFHVTRDADPMIQELEAADLLETIEQSVRRRRFGSVVRVKIDEATPAHVRELLIENLEMDRSDMYVAPGPLSLSDVRSLYAIERWDLKDPPIVPAVPAALNSALANDDYFAAIRQGDVLLHHPYDSFGPVVGFLRQAASDPDVLAIKQTLYRVGRNAPVVEALLEAIQNGKQVAALVELKARFDEESNISWARALEAEGVHVVYGLPGLKTHSKVALVVRKEGDGIRRYVHLATGNYNAVTALSYTDLGMFTCDEAIGMDATDLFNYLTGYSSKTDYQKLIVAPVNLRSRMTELIDREIAHGPDGHLIFKMNALVDRQMIRQLYHASQAGVQVDLIVRSMCCLRPGVPGVSDNIRVISIVGRFLEHSRIYYFRNAGAEEVYLGSADLMPRNIDRRVEVLFPITAEAMIRHLRDDVLQTYLADNVKTRRLRPDGAYEMIEPGPDEPEINSQVLLMNKRL